MKEKLFIPRGTGRITDMAWSPNGRKLAAITDRGWLLVWYPSSAQRIVSLQLCHRQLLCVAWSQQGTSLIVGDGRGALYRVEELSAPSPVIHCHLFDFAIRKISCSPGTRGRRYLVVSGSTLILMDEGGTETHLLYPTEILNAAWAEDGCTLAVVCADGLVELVDASQEQKRQPLAGVLCPQCLAWQKDGNLLAIGTTHGTVHLYDPPTNTLGEAVVCSRFPIRALAWGGGGLLLKDEMNGLTFVQEQEALPLASIRTTTFALNRAGTQLATVQLNSVAIAPF
ncbi:MAG TPA: WD40 repeat domain-containing protein [Ktedonobacteraceae bacterium]|nr:WD40 repeat domain-containing protein [Ktedonobacteraceae bacterium]